nr:YihY/virulence factor BrkB family protein [Pseudomonadota bacterium]
MQGLDQWSAWFYRQVWEKDVRQRSRPGRCAVWTVRLLYGIFVKFTDGELNLRAMSLVYTTLLSMVPLLAVSFSVLKAFGAYNHLGPFLIEFLAPLGEQGGEITKNILAFVDNIKVGVLGSLGIALLFYTVLTTLEKVEGAFNVIWHVPNTRSLARRFSDYLSVILIGPVLIFSALGVTATVLNSGVVLWLAAIEPFGTLVLIVSRTIPYLLVCCAFAFIYGFMPNTHVWLSSAVVGGVFAGVCWYTTGLIFTAFVVNSSNYSAIYSGFAGIILFMLWVYIGWLIVLVGAQVSFYWQNPRYLDPRTLTTTLGHRRRLGLALEIMALIGRAHYYKEPHWTFESLKNHVHGLRPDLLAELVQSLERHGLIMATEGKPSAYLPAHDIGRITLKEIINAVRGTDVSASGLPEVD